MKKLTLLAAVFFSGIAAAAEPADIAKSGQDLDRRLFDAYNSCDLKAFGDLLDPAVEFYHDKGGLMTGREAIVAAVKNNICGKVQRKLVPGTLHSSVMDNYGLVQLGEHLFCKIGTNQCEGVARFVHLWQLKDGSWHVTRIISYDHQSI